MCGTLLWENSLTTKIHVCNCCWSVGWKCHFKLSKKIKPWSLCSGQFWETPQNWTSKIRIDSGCSKKSPQKKKKKNVIWQLQSWKQTWKPFEITPSHSLEEKMKHTWIFRRGAWWRIKVAYTPSFKVRTAPFQRSWYVDMFVLGLGSQAILNEGLIKVLSLKKMKQIIYPLCEKEKLVGGWTNPFEKY